MVAALGSATNTNEALFLMKKYFQGRVDFRLGNETQTYQKQQDDLLRRLDKHPNTQGALDLGLAGNLNGLQGIVELAERKQIRAMWIAFHPQLVGEDAFDVVSNLERLLRAVDYSVGARPMTSLTLAPTSTCQWRHGRAGTNELCRTGADHESRRRSGW
jgi:hypothetical protein